MAEEAERDALFGGAAAAPSGPNPFADAPEPAAAPAPAPPAGTTAPEGGEDQDEDAQRLSLLAGGSKAAVANPAEDAEGADEFGDGGMDETGVRWSWQCVAT